MECLRFEHVDEYFIRARLEEKSVVPFAFTTLFADLADSVFVRALVNWVPVVHLQFTFTVVVTVTVDAGADATLLALVLAVYSTSHGWRQGVELLVPVARVDLERFVKYTSCEQVCLPFGKARATR